MTRKRFVFCDFNLEHADVIATAYIPEEKTLGIFINSFSFINQGEMFIKLRNAFPEIKKVQFLELRHAILNDYYPFERFQRVLFDKNTQVISWNASFETLLKIKDKLGSPYFMKHTKPKKENFISLQTLNEKAATKVNGKRVPTDLEFQSALAGYSIPQAPSIKFHKNRTMTLQSVNDLVFYLTHRTINTYRLFNTSFYQNIYQTKLNIIDNFNVQAHVDDTDAKICGMLLTDNQKIKFIDSNQFSFEIELNGKTVNLLEKLYQDKIIPNAVYQFYKKIEHANVKTYRKILNGKYNVKVPYYDKNLKPTKSYAVFSFGGNHGSLSSVPLDVPFEKEQVDVVPNKQLAEYTCAYSIDADNCYPSMNLKLGVFNDPTGKNYYQQIVKENIELKHSLPHDKSKWTKDDYQKSQRRLELKKISNTATGAADMNFDNSLLPLNNKTTSMRMLVNLIIYDLGTQFVRKLGANVISTNTDGIKIAFDGKAPEKSEIFKIAKEMDQKYGLHFEVKRIDRILVKDTNNLIEWSKNEDGLNVQNVTGKLSKGYQGNIPLDGNIDHPAIVDETVVAYLTEQPNETEQKWFTSYLKKKLKDFKGKEWMLVIRPTDNYQYCLNDQPLISANRVFLSVEGQTLHRIKNKTGVETKIPQWPSNTVKVINHLADLQDFAEDINIDAYVAWCLQILSKWTNKNVKQLSLLSKDNQVKYKQQEKVKVPKKKVVAKVKNSRLSQLLNG